MLMRLFKPIHSLHQAENQQNINEEKIERIKKDGITIFRLSDDIAIQMLHYITDVEKKELIENLPGLGHGIFRYDQSKPDKTKVIIGEGNTCKVHLAKFFSKNETQLIAVRKIRPDHVKEDGTIFSREEAINDTITEFKLQEELILLSEAQHFAMPFIIIDMENSQGKRQFYQIMHLANAGDGKHFKTLMYRARLDKQEQSLLFQYIAYFLLQLVARLHDKNFTLRDIKPQNILFSSIGEIWLADLGSSAYYKNLNNPLTASRSVDAAYQLPAEFLAKLDKLTKDKLNDKWKLALTLLQFCSDEINDFLEDHWLKNRYPAGSDLQEKKDYFEKVMTELKELKYFSEIAQPLQKILLEMLNIYNVQPLSSILKESGLTIGKCIEQSKVQSIFEKIITVNKNIYDTDLDEEETGYVQDDKQCSLRL